MVVSEIARFVNDVKASTKFYQKLLGVNPVHSDESISIFYAGNVKILIHEKYNDSKVGSLPCENHTAFKVKSLDDSFQKMQQDGLKFEIYPNKYEWGYSSYIRDPDGNLIELEQELI